MVHVSLIDPTLSIAIALECLFAWVELALGAGGSAPGVVQIVTDDFKKKCWVIAWGKPGQQIP